MTITEYLAGQARWLQSLIGLLLFALVVEGDYLTRTRYLLEFSPFYLVPISFFSWFFSQRAGLLAAGASLVTEFFVRLRAAPRATAYWDILVWFGLYACSALMMAQLRRLYDHERHLSRIDPLTMIDNRRAFFESALRAKSLSDRRKLPLSIAYLDLDDFKRLNDDMGHTTGDKVLVMVAASIRAALRPTDVIARIGGDEFAVLLPETDKETAYRVLSRVQRELERTMQEAHWPTTFSIGLISCSPPTDSVPALLQAADEAMYSAKKKGKNRVEQRGLTGESPQSSHPGSTRSA